MGTRNVTLSFDEQVLREEFRAFAGDIPGCAEKLRDALRMREKHYRRKRLERRIPIPTKAQLRGMSIFHRTKRPARREAEGFVGSK